MAKWSLDRRYGTSRSSVISSRGSRHAFAYDQSNVFSLFWSEMREMYSRYHNEPHMSSRF